jgi:ABC-type oligopeptide transport system ATPase subunit
MPGGAGAVVTAQGSGPQAPLLEVLGLRKEYVTTRGWPRSERHVVRAVDGVDFAVVPGETFGLVGESGCGKSTVARCVLNLIRPTRGDILFRGRNLSDLTPAEMRALRRDLQIVFQDPYSSLDPRMSIRASLLEPLEIHGIGSRAEREARVTDLLDRVGLGPSALRKYPHEFSGGQRQRIGIARALATAPKLVVADEPVSALDLSIRAQVINLMLELQRELSLTYVFIAHDLALVRQICDRVAVMRQGRIVELAPAAALFRDPQHPYTCRLLEAIPVPDPSRRLPDPAEPTEVVEVASEGQDQAELDPPLREVAPGHFARLS